MSSNDIILSRLRFVVLVLTFVALSAFLWAVAAYLVGWGRITLLIILGLITIFMGLVLTHWVWGWLKTHWHWSKICLILFIILLLAMSVLPAVFFWKEALAPVAQPAPAPVIVIPSQPAPVLAPASAPPAEPQIVYKDSPETLANLKSLEVKYNSLNKDSAETIAKLEAEKRILQIQVEKLAAAVPPKLPIPRVWRSFSGQDAMSLALKTFGNIRIKVFYSAGDVPSLNEAIKLIENKPKNVTLNAWIGGIQECWYWPTGMAITNRGGEWGFEIFLALDNEGIRYYYIEDNSVRLVDSQFISKNNIYWLFIDTPTYKE